MKKHNQLAVSVIVSTLSFSTWVNAGAGEPGHGHVEHKAQKTGHHDEGGHHGEGMDHGSVTGSPGKADQVDRTVKVVAGDDMRFAFSPNQFKAGETVQFLITNTGKLAHEFSIGTQKEHKAHGKMMRENPGMVHAGGGNSITVEPGKTGELIWQFSKAANIQAACNIPGHYEAGMHKSIKITP
ncbi:cupredoxin family protein [Endozoicomonas sp. SM1973]|uniref:Cupredoxin family protein n=1 Tax=Spartinivicinus marinus TaxID=2994442 RepID=A0A853IE98_9GAMM|nr:cupredoxin family protein [Spartinivicinus marinus]MCX4029719.1 cupredoxin family protein [Spartinivicinus marinus]NYZ70162.1 cupredoxin family protein [Spartinivicinus marinus]